jgi:small-conductance mechanosensitive channel
MFAKLATLFHWIILILFWLPADPAAALENDLPREDIGNLEQQINTYKYQLDDQKLAESELLQLVQKLSELTNKISSAIESIESDSTVLAEQITSLGTEIADEPLEVKNKRKALQNEKLKKDKWLSQYRLLLLRSEELLSSTKTRLNELLAQKFFHKGPSVTQLAYYVVDNASQLLSIYVDYVVNQNGLTKISISDYFIILVIASAVLIAGLWLKVRMLRWSSTKQWGDKFISRFFETFTLSSARHLPYLIVSLVLAFILHGLVAKIEPLPFIALLAFAIPVLVFGLYLIHLFLNPKLPARSFLPIPEKISRRLGHKVTILALIGFLSFLAIRILYMQKVPKQFLEFSWDVFVLLVVINLIWIVAYCKMIPQYTQKTLPRVLIVLALLTLLALELLGYRNLVFTIARTSAVALAGLVAVIILHSISRDFYDGLDTGVQPWHKKIRSKLGLKAKQPVPGMTFVRLVTLVVLWGGFLLFVISLLDFAGDIRQTIATLLVQGINLGDLNINPTRILMAIIVFTLLYTFSSWIKTQLERQWLSKARIDRGAKDALVTISGYIGVALALIIALSIAGVTFTNFAIIAGALSVGIGFGLQNIVNNFVSGLILLFERPIKNGDWIIVGSTEGHVKKISIRSTQIQTFDRADIIVPNSELVSTQVTNWMLHDRIGRVRISVGVAYGSDTEKVRQILYDVAMAHPNVIKNSTDYKISIFFLRFGDSSLDFELRCFIEDIDSALTVKSDLNFAVDKAFRENGVEIPFPQRDVHLKNTMDESSSLESS